MDDYVSDDTNVTTLTAYNADGNVSSVTAVNAETGNQVTEYVYGSTMPSSGIASSLLKVAEVYPDSVDGSDQVTFTYNIQSEVTTFTDQNGTVHNYVYDLLGRKTNDCITTVGTGIDTTVLQIATAYEVRGMVSGITSYSSATVGSGSVVNDVQLVYNAFAQLSADYQSHSEAVDMGTTPVVQYGYADGSANTIRPTTMTYPNGRVLNYDYGSSGGMNDALSRISFLIDNDGVTHLADHSYLGQSSIIEVDEPQPGLSYTLLGLIRGNDPVTGDIYQGLDLFSRIKDLIWTSSGGSSSSSSSSSSGAANVIERIQHGYDVAGNRLWRKELADSAETHDELYDYDGIYRLKDMQRGTLNVGETAISSETFAQCWGLDATGNWQNFQQGDTGSGVWDLVQGRTSNTVNEITAVNNSVGSSWVTPAYDAAGNMTTMSQPASLGSSFVGTYDAWNRLMTLSAGDSQVAGYGYDGMKRRTVKQVYVGGALSQTRDMYYSARWQVLEERINGATTPDRQFVWGLRYIDDIALRDRDPNGIGVLTERLFGFQDPNWNLTGIADASGTVQERYGYDAYGMPTVLTAGFVVLSGSQFDWETWYAGYRCDGESGLYQVRNRIYSGLLGLWATRDPFTLSAGLRLTPDTNPYRYVQNDPLQYIDPTGLWKWLGGKRQQGRPRAIMIAEEGDNVTSAARFTRLSAVESGKWLRDSAGNPIALGQKITPCKRYSVPNIFLIAQGDLGFISGTYVKRLEDQVLQSASSLGFNVQVVGAEYGTSVTQAIQAMNDNNVWGMFMVGHGYINQTWYWTIDQDGAATNGAFVWKPTGRAGLLGTVYDLITPQDLSRRPKYGLLITFFCYANLQNWRRLVSPYGSYYGGSTAVFAPRGPGTVSNFRTWNGLIQDAESPK